MEGVKHPSKCFQQAGPPVVSPSATADQLLDIVFSEGKWCFGLIALVQQPQMSKTLTSAEDLTVTFILFVFLCVVGVLFLLKARYQVTKQCFCSCVLSGCLFLASRVGLKAFYTVILRWTCLNSGSDIDRDTWFTLCCGNDSYGTVRNYLIYVLIYYENFTLFTFFFFMQLFMSIIWQILCFWRWSIYL